MDEVSYLQTNITPGGGGGWAHMQMKGGTYNIMQKCVHVIPTLVPKIPPASATAAIIDYFNYTLANTWHKSRAH